MGICREMVTLAVENHPGHLKILELETSLQFSIPIFWHDVLLPAAEQPQQQSLNT